MDLPGYGYAKVSREMREQWRELLGDYFDGRQSLAGLMLVVDSRRGIGDFDWQMLDWGQTLGCAIHVLLTKVDKLSRLESVATLTVARNAIRDKLGTTITSQLFSATTRQGVDEARATLEAMLPTV